MQALLPHLRKRYLTYGMTETITHIAMSPALYADYVANTWTESGGPNGMSNASLPNGGVVPMPGQAGVTAVIDPMITTDVTMYAVNKANALRLGEGPKIMRRHMRKIIQKVSSFAIINFYQHI